MRKYMNAKFRRKFENWKISKCEHKKLRKLKNTYAQNTKTEKSIIRNRQNTKIQNCENNKLQIRNWKIEYL